MKFSIQRASFIKYLNDVQRAISSKTTIDILTGLKMDLSKDALTLTGSNSDISIETIILPICYIINSTHFLNILLNNSSQ